MRSSHVLSLALAAGCAATSGPGGLAPDMAAPDFSLVDQNPTSASYDQAISPRDHLDRISAWYFGHAS